GSAREVDRAPRRIPQRENDHSMSPFPADRRGGARLPRSWHYVHRPVALLRQAGEARFGVMRTLLRQGICRAARLKKSRTHSSVHRIEAAADPDGTFAIVRMAPCFPGSVKIATVVAARPNAVLSRRRPSRPRRCGQAWFGRPGLPRRRAVAAVR